MTGVNRAGNVPGTATSLDTAGPANIGNVTAGDYAQFTSSTGNPGNVNMRAQGVDANINLNYAIKGTGTHTFSGPVVVNGFLTCANTVQGEALVAASFSVSINTAGFGVRIKGGSNARIGSATLVAGSVVVPNTSVTALSRIMLTTQTPGGSPGAPMVASRINGTSFTIGSTSGTDTSTVGYVIFEEF